MTAIKMYPDLRRTFFFVCKKGILPSSLFQMQHWICTEKRYTERFKLKIIIQGWLVLFKNSTEQCLVDLEKKKKLPALDVMNLAHKWWNLVYNEYHIWWVFPCNVKEHLVYPMNCLTSILTIWLPLNQAQLKDWINTAIKWKWDY